MQIQIREAFERSLKLRGDRIYLYLFALCCVSLGTSAPAQAEPAPIDRDPPLDRAHPASGQGLQFTSNGELVNAMLYLPAGVGPHPAVILLHGLPGNEQNLDLARAMQRAGWAVITFHYRGSWGSGGKFTLSGGCADIDALLREIEGASRNFGQMARLIHTELSLSGIATAASSPRAPAGAIRNWAAIGLISRRGTSATMRANLQSFLQRRPTAAHPRRSMTSMAGSRVPPRCHSCKSFRTDGAKLGLTDIAPSSGRASSIAGSCDPG